VSRDAGGSFEDFVRGRSAHLFRLALLLTGQNEAEAEDLLQIALERAYRRRPSLSRNRDPEPYGDRRTVGQRVGTVKSQASRGLKRLRELTGVSRSGHRGSPTEVQERP